LNELLRSDDPAVQDIALNVDWYIIPMTNPDGYEWTRNEYRLWRKTRSVHSLLCFGVDANRNFEHNWLYNNEGASKVPCTDTFAGPEPFSEPETQAIRGFLDDHLGIYDAYISFHSYGQMILSIVASTKNV